MIIYILIDITLIDGDKGQSYIRDKLNPHMPDTIPIIIANIIICAGDFAISLAPIAGMISNDPIKNAPISFILTDITKASINSIANSIVLIDIFAVVAISGSRDIITILSRYLQINVNIRISIANTSKKLCNSIVKMSPNNIVSNNALSFNLDAKIMELARKVLDTRLTTAFLLE